LKTYATFLVVLAAGLAGCGQRVDDLGRTAESVRTATEHMASDSKAASAAREARILADAAEMDERRQIEEPDATLPVRYEVRRDAGGWSVYDTNTGRVARRGATTQAGLSRTNADQAAWDLQVEENEARYRAALAGSVR